LSIADSVLAVIDGVVRANNALEGYRREIGASRSVHVGALEFVERAADRAEQAVHAVRGAAERLGLKPDDFDFSAVTLESRRDGGGMPASLPTDPGEDKEVQLSILAHEPGDGGELEVDVTLLGRDARVDARTHGIDVGVVDAITARLPSEPGLASTLFDLLIPEEFEQRMSFSAPIQLIVDQHTANIPWELLSAPLVGDRRGALANVGGIIRRFAEADASRLAPRRAVKQQAMVVAAGRVAGEAPLPGVLDEAAEVAKIFRNEFQVEVNPLTDEREDLDQVVFMQQLLSENRFVHIASHGTFEEDGSVAAAILGPGLRLTPSLVSKIRIVPEIVFLNCCQLAGIGSRRFAPGMARQLMAIGVRAVIAAGWNISDAAAVGFARSFWQSMSEGDSLGQAVLEARRTAGNLGGGTTWAAYQCYGDPGLRLSRGSRSRAGRLIRPASADDLMRNLDALAVRATDVRTRRPGEVLERVVLLRAEFAELRDAAREFGHADNPLVQRRLGVCARQLGLFGAAAAAYRAVIQRPGAEQGKDLEQLANLEARFAQRRTRLANLESDIGDPSLVDAPVAELFELARSRVHKALEIAPSAERYGVLGSIYKKEATTVSDKRTRTKLIRSSFENYCKAAELSGPKGYGLENARQLGALIGKAVPQTAVSERAQGGEGPHGAVLVDERSSTADYWGLAASGDQLVSELLLGGSAGAGLRDGIVRAYRQAFSTRSSASERDSVFTHLRDLRRLAPPDDPRGVVLREILEALEEWEPFADPAPELPGAPATPERPKERAMPSRSDDLVVSMFPAGPGDALLLEWGPPGDRRSMLIDGGLSLDAESELGTYLSARHSPPFVDVLVVTHVDADHVQGAIDAVGERGLTYGDVWFNGTNQLITDRSIAQGCAFDSLTLGENRNPMMDGKAIVVPDQGPLTTVTLAHGAVVTFLSPDNNRLGRLAKKWRAALDACGTRGDAGEGGGLDAFLEALGDEDESDGGERGAEGATPKWGSDTSIPNGSSIAFLFEYENSALLFTGDAHSAVIEESLVRLLIDRKQNRLSVDAFKVSHHGSAYNVTPELLDLIDCARFLVSTDGSRHGHPDATTIELIRAKHPDALILLNYDNEAVRHRAGSSDNVVYRDGESAVVYGG
jgi:beta-lactamase superfamily II metal-dependent hydrolase